MTTPQKETDDPFMTPDRYFDTAYPPGLTDKSDHQGESCREHAEM
jgi:hypothetical protein